MRNLIELTNLTDEQFEHFMQVLDIIGEGVCSLLLDDERFVSLDSVEV